MKKQIHAIIVSLLTIIFSTFVLLALFSYLSKINVELSSPSIEIYNEDNVVIDNLKWKNNYNQEVSVFSSNEEYHLDSFVVKNTGNSNINLSFTISSSNIDNLDDYLTLRVEGGTGVLVPDSSKTITIYITIKDGISNDYQGTSINDLTINITSTEDVSYDD